MFVRRENRILKIPREDYGGDTGDDDVMDLRVVYDDVMRIPGEGGGADWVFRVRASRS